MFKRLLASAVILVAVLPSGSRSDDASPLSQATPDISSLSSQLESGSLVLTRVRGNGNSSGTVLDASLRNTTANGIRIAVRLDGGMYFANGTASAQNMIATSVYEAGGRYWVADDIPFIEVPAGDTQSITFNAYCVDFERDNPDENDRLETRIIPPHLTDIVRKMLDYEEEGTDSENIMVAVQLALWLAQGHQPEEIRERFSFTPLDLLEARWIVNQP